MGERPDFVKKFLACQKVFEKGCTLYTALSEKCEWRVKVGRKLRVIALFFLLCVVQNVRKMFAERPENACRKTRKFSESDRHKDKDNELDMSTL